MARLYRFLGGRGAPDVLSESEHASVGPEQPVVMAAGSGGYPDDRLVRRTGRAVEPRVAEAEDAAVGCDEPLAVARWCRPRRPVVSSVPSELRKSVLPCEMSQAGGDRRRSSTQPRRSADRFYRAA